jgi:energy-coupling factor transporter ATP-binding protein EcfA2
MIKTIAIENVRGIQSQAFNLNILPNRPSLLVAPNGFGKSSIAAAFAGLRTKRLEIPKEQHHLGQEHLAPKLTLLLRQDDQDVTVSADSATNTISSVVDVHVVTSRLRAKATARNMGSFTTATASLAIDDLVLVGTIPEKAKHAYDIKVIRDHFGGSAKALRNLDKIIDRPGLADGLADLFGAMDKLEGARLSNELAAVTAMLQANQGTADAIRAWAEQTIAPRLEAIEAIRSLADLIGAVAPVGQTRVDALLSGMQVSLIYREDKKTFKRACKYLSYVNEKESFEDILKAFGKTWKNVRPTESKGKLVVHFPSAMHISNGQRDSLCFAAELRKIERSIGSRDVIVVIDEVFDYLDDANLVAVQYYITRLIKKVRERGCNAYALILTHLNPYYFKNFTFAKQKIYFLKQYNPAINKAFRDLVIKREDPAIAAGVSRHHLHYDPAPINLRAEFKAMGLKETWGDSNLFHAHTAAEWKKYASESDNYDPFAVCCFVRVGIEKLVHDALPDQATKTAFLDTKKTPAKLDFAASRGIDIDDTLYLLGVIYNEGLHIRDNVDDSSPIVTKLENRTIRHMLIDSLGAPAATGPAGLP